MPRSIVLPSGHALGWHRQHPDIRDKRFDHLAVAPPTLPTSVDLRPRMPAVYDQGQLGSCTANMGAGLLEFALLKYGFPDFTPSRLFIYYNERVIGGDTADDTGAQCRDALTVLHNLGACPETEWPYDVSQFAVRPSDQAYQDAKKTIATAYLAVDQTLDACRSALACGYPVGFGFTVYSSFESQAVADTGIMPMPGLFESVLGGHAVIRVGYYDNAVLPVTLPNGAMLNPHDSGGYWIVRNSWSDQWGDKGHYYAPYGTDAFSSDYWVLQTIN